MCVRYRARQRGFMSVFGMIVALLLFTIGVGLLSPGFDRRMTSLRAGWEICARSGADYALAKALYEMNQRLTAGTIDDSNLPFESDALVPAADARYSYTVSGDMWNGYSVHASGSSGFVTRHINCDLRLKGAFEYAILTRSTLDLVSNSRVDWFNYDADDPRLKIGTTSILPDSVILKSGCLINGDVLIGQGGIPSVVVNDLGATIKGSIFPVATDFDITMPTVPDYLSTAPSNGSIDKDSPLIITTSGRYDSIRLRNGETLTIDGDVELYVTGNIILDNSARIVISPTNPDAKLTIYLAGSMDGLNGSGFNNLNDPNSVYPAGDPHKLTLYGLPSCTSVIVKNSAVFCGTIYAPNANIDMHNSAELYGAVVARTYLQRNSATFWYDASLGEATPDDALVRFVPTHWRES